MKLATDHFKSRTARKHHACNGDGTSIARHASGCPLTIKPGEEYVEYLGETPAYHSGSRHSVACAAEYFDLEAEV